MLWLHPAKGSVTAHGPGRGPTCRSSGQAADAEDPARGAAVHSAARLRLRCFLLNLVAEGNNERCPLRPLFDAAGAAAIHRAAGLEGCWRDALTISRHALVAAGGRQLAGAHQ